MGQANQKLMSLDDKFKIVEVERDDLRKKGKEADVKIEVLGGKQADDQTQEQYAKELECALEEALIERKQILEAAEKEIEHERNIAIELEQKMMEDFEWKLREVEGRYKTKIKDLEESLDGKTRTTTLEIIRQKDEELTKMCMDARQEMEETLRTERNNLKSSMEAAAKTDKENYLATLTLQKDREIRILQRSAENAQNKLTAEITRLNSKMKEEIAAQVNKIRIEEDAKLFDVNRKYAKIIEKYSDDYDKIKEELTGEINRLRAEHSEIIEDYEAKLESAESIKSASMFQIKDGVENEFSERMEELRNIYRIEIDQQHEQYSKDMVNWKQLETCQSNKLKETTQTLTDTTAYYTARETELEAKVDDLLTRLQEQTSQVFKLQTEFDEYDWYDQTDDENEDGNENPKNAEMPMNPNSRNKCRSKSNSKETLLGRSSQNGVHNETPVHVLSEDEEVKEETFDDCNMMDIPLLVIEPLPQASARVEPYLPNTSFSTIPRNLESATAQESLSTLKRNSKEKTPPPVPMRGAGLSLPEDAYRNSYHDDTQSITSPTLVVPFAKSENTEHSDDNEPLLIELPADIYKKALKLPDLSPSEMKKIKKPELLKDELLGRLQARVNKLQEPTKAKKTENTVSKSWSSFLSSNYGWGNSPAKK